MWLFNITTECSASHAGTRENTGPTHSLINAVEIVGEPIEVLQTAS
jgi:hypothetical protein